MSTNLAELVKASLIQELESLRDAVGDLAAPLDERQFWLKPLEPGNSFGHLVLHLTGNLNWFVGGQLGATGYVRDRERKFSEANPPAKAEALARLEEAVATFRHVVQGLTAEQMAASHPSERFGNVVNALIRVTSHFALHRDNCRTSPAWRPARPGETARPPSPQGRAVPGGASLSHFPILPVLACGLCRKQVKYPLSFRIAAVGAADLPE